MCVSSSTRSRSTFTNDESERAERSWYRPRRPTSDSLSSILDIRLQPVAWLKAKRRLILKLQNSSLCLARAKNRRNSRSPPSSRSTTVYRKESPTLSFSLLCQLNCLFCNSGAFWQRVYDTLIGKCAGEKSQGKPPDVEGGLCSRRRRQAQPWQKSRWIEQLCCCRQRK